MTVEVLLDEGAEVSQRAIAHKLRGIWYGTLERTPSPGEYMLIEGDCYEVASLVWDLDKDTLLLVVRHQPPAGHVQWRI